MKKILYTALLFLCLTALASAQETFTLWPGLPPGEKEGTEVPVCDLYRPATLTTDACMIVFPGGGYMKRCDDREGQMIAQYYNSKGMTAVVVKYRIPRREGLPKHMAAWQDAQRAVRLVRSHADEWQINPNKIGCTGFSAGGHLTLMTATTSLTNAYEPIDELDNISASVNFAVPVYPAYVLQDGADAPNKEKGLGMVLVPEFAFDAATPTMCFIHGDDDPYSALNSAAVYRKLHEMGIPAEMHIYAKTGHGFGASPTGNHLGTWLDRVWDWLVVSGFGTK